VRTCVGCRSRAPASTLLRVVAVIQAGVATLVPDPRHRLPGRGAYLHVDPACLAKAERRRAFGRALRVAGVLDTGELAAYVTAHGSPAGAGATGMTDGGHDGGSARQGRAPEGHARK
jgi:predicted RNA-binding protein YlxR (DUF448 family)